MENPWLITSIYDLQYFNCPSCIFKNPSKQEIVNHAYDFHPEAIEHLMNIYDNSFMDISLPWNVEVKKEINNEELEYESYETTVKDEFNEDPLNKEINHFNDMKNYPQNYCEINFSEDEKHIRAVQENIKIETVDYYNEIPSINQEIPEILNPIKQEDTEPKLINWNNFCYQCGKSFSKASDLKRHVKAVHDGIKDHTCDLCGRSFAKKDQLNNHVKAVHEKIKDHKCKHCDKSFSEAGTLRNHVKGVHDRIKNYKCDHCEKSFAIRSNLRQHIKAIHERIKDHSCGICGRSFALSSHLKVHIKSVHEGSKDHKCDTCEKSFSSIGQLNYHNKVVHEESKDHKCHFCEKNFYDGGTLKRHIERKHKESFIENHMLYTNSLTEADKLPLNL